MDNDFGDFQTPLSLVMAVLERLYTSGKTWSRVLEPTCGRGNFIEGLLKLTTPPFNLVDKQALQARMNNELEQLGLATEKATFSWPSTMEEFLMAYLDKTNYASIPKDSTGIIKQLSWIS